MAKNPKDPTPTERLFKSYYVGIQRQWNREAYHELCVKLNYTKFELGALIGRNRREVAAGLRVNRFSLPACRHLQMMKRFTDMKRGITLEPDPLDDYIT